MLRLVIDASLKIFGDARERFVIRENGEIHRGVAETRLGVGGTWLEVEGM